MCKRHEITCKRHKNEPILLGTKEGAVEITQGVADLIELNKNNFSRSALHKIAVDIMEIGIKADATARLDVAYVSPIFDYRDKG